MDEFLRALIKEAGQIALKYFKLGVNSQEKSNPGDLLTEADLAVEKILVDRIHKKYPSHHIHSEEMVNDINPGAECEWVIDPIDGTRNFAAGVPIFAIFVAVLKNGIQHMAAVYSPVSDQLFFAEQGKGAFLNGKQITVNDVDTLDHCFGVIARNNSQDLADFNKMFVRYINETSGWEHNFGTVLGACFLANGGPDFYVSNCGFDHDYLAPTLICQEAGAKVTNSKGQPWQRHMRDLVIANPSLHSKVLELFG